MLRNVLPDGAVAMVYEDGLKAYSSTSGVLQLLEVKLAPTGMFLHDDYMNTDGSIAMWHFAAARHRKIRLMPMKTLALEGVAGYGMEETAM